MLVLACVRQAPAPHDVLRRALSRIGSSISEALPERNLVLRLGSASTVEDLALAVPSCSADVLSESAAAASGSGTLIDDTVDSQRTDMVQQVLRGVTAYHSHLEARLQAYREYLKNAETRQRSPQAAAPQCWCVQFCTGLICGACHPAY